MAGVRKPVVVISGFLGAGKTTLLNSTLGEPGGRKLGVIVNDLDTLNIDKNLIRNANNNTIALSNGCICCTLKDDMVKTVSELAHSERELDGILVETSGVTDPLAMAMSIRLLEDAGVVRLETLVYLVDASSFDELDYDDAECVLSHAAIADLILLSKADLTSEDKLRELETTTRSAVNAQPVIRSDPNNFDVSLLFAPTTAPDRNPALTTRHHDYLSWSRKTLVILDRMRFDRFASALSTVAWRAKGLLRFSDNPNRVFLFNQVGKRATLEFFDSASKETGTSNSEIVVIARKEKLKHELLDAEFTKLIDHKNN